jgi:hypothetical protein
MLPSPAAQLLTGVPYVTSGGGTIGLHPATWLIIVAIATRLAAQPVRSVSVLLDRGGIAATAIALTLAAAVISTWSVRGTQGFAQLVETLAGPPGLLFLALIAARDDDRLGERLCRWVQLGALAAAALAVGQYLLERHIVFESYYGATAWHAHFAIYGYRSPAFLDHPLTAGLLMTAAMPLMRIRVGRQRRAPGLPGSLLLVAGITATGSRTALVCALAYLVVMYLIGRAGESAWRRVGALALGPLLAYSIVAYTSLGVVIMNRFATDTSSYAIRSAGAAAFWDRWTSFVFTGTGVGGSAALSQELLNRATSFENAAIMLAADVGILATALFYIAIFSFAMHGRREHLRSFPLHTVLLAVLVSLSYSSYGTKSVAGYVVWLFVSVAVCADRDVAPISDRARRHTANGRSTASDDPHTVKPTLAHR